MKNPYKNHYNFTVTHRLADGTEVTEEQIKQYMSSLPPLELNLTVQSEVQKCSNL